MEREPCSSQTILHSLKQSFLTDLILCPEAINSGNHFMGGKTDFLRLTLGDGVFKWSSWQQQTCCVDNPSSWDQDFVRTGFFSRFWCVTTSVTQGKKELPICCYRKDTEHNFHSQHTGSSLKIINTWAKKWQNITVIKELMQRPNQKVKSL